MDSTFHVQNLIATKLGVQRISGITVSDTREKKSYDPVPDMEVGTIFVYINKWSYMFSCYLKLVISLSLRCMYIHGSLMYLLIALQIFVESD